MRGHMRSLVVAAALALLVLACKDKGELSTARAAEHASTLAARVAADVDGIDQGLSAAAAEIGEAFAPGKDDPRSDVNAMHDLLVRARAHQKALDAATDFLAFTTPEGKVLRNDLVVDEMEGQDFAASFPGLRGLTGPLEQIGSIAAAPGDDTWIDALPVRSKTGDIVGLLVAGMSFRRAAGRLADGLRKDLFAEIAGGPHPDEPPVFYVAIFDAHGAFPAPLTPALDEKTLRELDLVDKTARGPWKTTMPLSGRPFGVAATRTPKLGADAGVVVMRSEL